MLATANEMLNGSCKNSSVISDFLVMMNNLSVYIQMKQKKCIIAWYPGLGYCLGSSKCSQPQAPKAEVWPLWYITIEFKNLFIPSSIVQLLIRLLGKCHSNCTREPQHFWYLKRWRLNNLFSCKLSLFRFINNQQLVFQ